mmetsp:Transcript_35458/g.95066  ORF Transcript_35458/g.95066 Transcript_35458/m.95066 type:complete len:330 (+) Transcript_35458:607-1596(+)
MRRRLGHAYPHEVGHGGEPLDELADAGGADRHVRHLTAPGCRRLAVPVAPGPLHAAQARELCGRRRRRGLGHVRDDVDHQGGAHSEAGVVRQGEAHHGPHVRLELIAATSLHGVMAGVVRAWRHLVQGDGPVREQEELHAEDARRPGAQAPDCLRGHLAHGILYARRGRSRADGGVADAVFRGEVHHWVGARVPVAAPHDHDGHLLLEGAPLLRVARLSAEAGQGRGDALRGRHHGVALAVVGALPGLEHVGVAELVAGLTHGVLVGRVHEGPQRHPVSLEVQLLVQLVLDQADRVGGGLHLDALLHQRVQRVAVDVLDLCGDEAHLLG